MPDSLTPLPPGFHKEVLRLKDGTELRYALAVPEAAATDAALPLVLSLHYGGPVSPYYGGGMLEYLVRPGLGELGALMVAPDSIAGPWSAPRNEAAVLELLDRLAEAYEIDPERTLVTGYSMGGAGTWFFATRHPDRFRAAIPMAGSPASVDGCPIPIYALHSPADDIVPIGPARRAIEALGEKGCKAEMHEVEGIPHFESSRFSTHLKKAVPWVRSVWSGD